MPDRYAQDRSMQDRYSDDRARDLSWDTSRMSTGMGGQDRWEDRGREYGREGMGRSSGSRDDDRMWVIRPDTGPGSGYGFSSGAAGDRSGGRMDDRGGDMRWRNLRWDADQQTWRGQDDFGRQDGRGGQGMGGNWGRPGQDGGYSARGDSGWQGQGGQSAWGGARGESYRGRGPKGYQRSDDRIKEMVSDALEDDDRLDASNIEVQVQGGEVTLTGTVSDRAQKRRAEDCVDTLRGVKDVHNQLRVQQGTAGTSSNAAGNGMTGTTNRNDTTPTVSSTAKS